MAIKLITDSCCDLQQTYLDQNNIECIPLMFTIDGKDYFDDHNDSSMSCKEFYQKMRDGSMSTTSLINTQRYEEVFTKYLEDGDDIVYLAFSSALSGSYQSAVIAANELREKYPDRKIAVIDSKCASMGEGLFVYYATRKLKEKPEFDEYVEFVKELQPKVCHWFTVDDLHHLKRGGRVSSFSATLGTMLKIKPVLHVDDEGRLIPMSKARGRNASLSGLVKEMERTIIDEGREQTIMISHGDCVDDAYKVADMVTKKFPLVKDVIINYVGPIIGTHSGPGTVALFFLGSER
jgi:DegV family protein with EDD domain